VKTGGQNIRSSRAADTAATNHDDALGAGPHSASQSAATSIQLPDTTHRDPSGADRQESPAPSGASNSRPLKLADLNREIKRLLLQKLNALSTTSNTRLPPIPWNVRLERDGLELQMPDGWTQGKLVGKSPYCCKASRAEVLQELQQPNSRVKIVVVDAGIDRDSAQATAGAV
jgi:hypothetical protein